MIKVLAIDDEPLALQQLASYIQKVPFLQLVGQCQSALEAKDILYAVEGFKVNAVDYLLKPFGLDDFRRAANRLKERLEVSSSAAPAAEIPQSNADDDDTIFIKTDYKVVKIAISDIRYIEGMSEYLKIHLEGQPKPIVTLLSMKKMEEYLPPSFMRIHRSYIVNLKRIQEVNKNRVIMDADTYLPIGDNYKEAFNDYLNTRFLGK